MPLSKATTVAAYLAELPPERRAVVSAVRKIVLEHLPAGYQESMGFGMICYGIPLSVYPDTYALFEATRPPSRRRAASAARS
jgi:hypothetical protein